MLYFRLPFVFLLAALLVLSGCASYRADETRNADDPLERFNRASFSFNEKLDEKLAKPIAQGYEKIPFPVRQPANNFFANLEDIWSTVNHALQLHPGAFVESTMRVGVNTLWGIGGLINVADSMGLERDTQDMGKTLGRWGVGSGAYIVVPVLGPSTMRDVAALPVDMRADPLRHLPISEGQLNNLRGLRLVDKRTGLLLASNFLDEASLDKYAFMRNAFMQKRQSEIEALRNQESMDEDGAPSGE